MKNMCVHIEHYCSYVDTPFPEVLSFSIIIKLNTGYSNLYMLFYAKQTFISLVNGLFMSISSVSNGLVPI